MIVFRTINVDGVEVERKFNSIEEIGDDWYSDDCSLPSLDDEVIVFYYDDEEGHKLTYGADTFFDIVKTLGIIDVDGNNRYKEYYVEAFEEELGSRCIKVKVPAYIPRDRVIRTFTMAKNYLDDRFEIDDNKDYIEETNGDFEGFVKDGVTDYDSHFEKMIGCSDLNGIDAFIYYISECIGWEAEQYSVECDFYFEW